MLAAARETLQEELYRHQNALVGTLVLSTTVFLELSVGRLEAAVAVSLLMVVAAVIVLGIVRLAGGRVAG